MLPSAIPDATRTPSLRTAFPLSPLAGAKTHPGGLPNVGPTELP
jgi:hypothetical protein